MAEFRNGVLITPLTDGQLKAIGLVAFRWTVVQGILDSSIWGMIPCHNLQGKAVTTELADLAKIQIARTLAGQRLRDKDLATFQDFTVRFDEIRVRRNQIIHNQWLRETHGLAEGIKPTAKGNYLLNQNYWSEADILDLADEIEELALEWLEFIMARSFDGSLGSGHPPSP